MTANQGAAAAAHIAAAEIESYQSIRFGKLAKPFTLLISVFLVSAVIIIRIR